METSNLSSIYSKTAQRALFRNVYVWMTMALAITGLVAMYAHLTANDIGKFIRHVGITDC